MAKRTKTKAQLEAENRAMLEALQAIVAYTVDDVPEEYQKNAAFPYAFGFIQATAEIAIRCLERGL